MGSGRRETFHCRPKRRCRVRNLNRSRFLNATNEKPMQFPYLQTLQNVCALEVAIESSLLISQIRQVFWEHAHSVVSSQVLSSNDLEILYEKKMHVGGMFHSVGSLFIALSTSVLIVITWLCFTY